LANVGWTCRANRSRLVEQLAKNSDACWRVEGKRRPVQPGLPWERNIKIDLERVIESGLEMIGGDSSEGTVRG